MLRKKIISIFVALVIVISVCVVAVCAEDTVKYIADIYNQYEDGDLLIFAVGDDAYFRFLAEPSVSGLLQSSWDLSLYRVHTQNGYLVDCIYIERNGGIRIADYSAMSLHNADINSLVDRERVVFAGSCASIQAFLADNSIVKEVTFTAMIGAEYPDFIWVLCKDGSSYVITMNEHLFDYQGDGYRVYKTADYYEKASENRAFYDDVIAKKQASLEHSNPGITISHLCVAVAIVICVAVLAIWLWRRHKKKSVPAH